MGNVQHLMPPLYLTNKTQLVTNDLEDTESTTIQYIETRSTVCLKHTTVLKDTAKIPQL